MNIDIRNIDSEFEEAIEEIKKEDEKINTNSKAIRYATIILVEHKNLIKSQSKIITELKDQLENNKIENTEISDFFRTLHHLTKRFK